MKRISELAVAFFDLAEAEGRLFRAQFLRVIIGCMFYAGVLVVALWGLSWLGRGINMLLVEYLGAAYASIIVGVFFSIIAGVLAWQVNRRVLK